MALRRLNEEWSKFFQDNRSNSIFAEPINNDIFHWRGKIMGPTDTPFEGGIFSVDIIFPQGYPLKPSKYTMITKMFHPNISSDGEISLTIFNRDWVPIWTIDKVLLSISSILNTPNMEHPINLEAAQCLREDPEKYNSIVQQYILNYARSDYLIADNNTVSSS